MAVPAIGRCIGGWGTVTDGMDEVGATRPRAGLRPRAGIVAAAAVAVASGLLPLLVPALGTPRTALASGTGGAAVASGTVASGAAVSGAAVSGAASATSAAAGPAAPASTAPVVREIPLSGPVDPFVARMVERGIDRAATDDDAAVLLRIDTPGGLDSSMRDIVKAIQSSRVPVVCWVGPSGARAASAGTFILIGCPVAAMAPGTNVGAAHPVGITGDVMSEKVTNDAAAYIRSLAESRDRNADWAEKAVRDSVSISADEAVRLHVADMVSPSVADLLNAVDGTTVATAAGDVTARTAGATVTEEHLTAGEDILHTLADPNIAFLFFVLGIAGLVIELLHPGISIPGVGGLILLVTSLVIMSVLPVNVGALVLIAAAFVFFVIDLKVPGHGIPTAAGIACLVVGGLYLYSGGVPDAQVSRPLIAGLALGLAGMFFFVVRGALRARRAPVTTGVEALVGSTGTVLDELAPTGMVAVRGEHWSARLASPGPAVVAGRPVRWAGPGEAVRVVAVDGLTLEVVPAYPYGSPGPGDAVSGPTAGGREPDGGEQEARGPTPTADRQ